MTLSLYYHPLASFCHKVLIALYENDTPFEPHLVDKLDAEANAAFAQLWPVGKMPVLRDDSRGQVLPETSVIIEYLDRYYPGSVPLLPRDADARLQVRLWDRFYDLYVHHHMQKIVTDCLRPEGQRDPAGVAMARNDLQTAYEMIDREMGTKAFAAGDAFSMADCAAFPALFYVDIVEPLFATHPNAAAYFERLLERPSIKRVLDEARPYFENFPYAADIPTRFREDPNIAADDAS